jgi:hypothetical protein
VSSRQSRVTAGPNGFETVSRAADGLAPFLKRLGRSSGRPFSGMPPIEREEDVAHGLPLGVAIATQAIGHIFAAEQSRRAMSRSAPPVNHPLRIVTQICRRLETDLASRRRTIAR